VVEVDFRDQVVLITGASRGIGRALAIDLARRGATVIGCARSQQDLEETLAEMRRLSPRSTVRVCDVSKRQEVDRMMKEVLAEFGRIDILVNNAGIAGPNHPLWEYPPDAWRQVIEIDLNAVFYCCRAVVPRMIAQNYGRIVNVASIAGKEGNPSASAYAAAKSGVIALTKALGKELATHDIAVNCITPAAARTRIFDQITQEFVDFMLSKIPRGRFVNVEEIAAMVAWLVSAENSFTTGAVFDLSGGRATY
jgi:3-oxoacyl-[acyl-carrier protein] reductase